MEEAMANRPWREPSASQVLRPLSSPRLEASYSCPMTVVCGEDRCTEIRSARRISGSASNDSQQAARGSAGFRHVRPTGPRTKDVDSGSETADRQKWFELAIES